MGPKRRESTRDDGQAKFDRQSSLARTHSVSLHPSTPNTPNDPGAQRGDAPKSQARSLQSLAKINKIFRASQYRVLAFERQAQRDARETTEKSGNDGAIPNRGRLSEIRIFERAIPPRSIRLPS